MKKKKNLHKFSFYVLFVVTVIFVIPSASGKSKSNHKIILKWENPDEGTAVDFNTEKEYLRNIPVLSSHGEPSETITEVSLEPVLQKLILPGSENVDNAEEELFPDGMGLRIAKKALEYFEKKTRVVNINGQNLNIETDCSYFVRAAYWEGSGHTIDLFREAVQGRVTDLRTATGVILLDALFRKNHKFDPKSPRVGDVIIFDNTYDKNNNQKRDDYYTHTGIVTGIRQDHTIEFVHGNIGRTIRKGYINFDHKNISVYESQPVNSYIRARYSWDEPVRSLASYLVRGFGRY
ncbi:MAG: CHAP domain-containing protein [Spirochaetia bacterium]|nr:CHAP domain-containing protein [Spirochaetia bacterium]